MEILETHGDSNLFDLIERGAHEPALELLKGDNHISEDELNKSLMAACQQGHKLLVQMLTERGANVSLKDTNGNTPLIISVQNGFNHIVEFLLTNKADVNAINSVGDSALILSIGLLRSREVIRNLLKQPGINIHHQNQDGYTAIMKAAEVKNIDALKILLDKHFNVDSTETSASFYEHVAEHKTHKRTLDAVSDGVAKWTTLEDTVNCRGENVIQIAKRCEIGNVFQLLQGYVDTRISPLELAIRADDIKSFLIFLECAFNYAAHNKKYLNFMLKHIFRTCCNTDMDFSENKIATVKTLLEHGADVNTSWIGQTVFVTKSPSKRVHFKGSTTPVHVAAKIGCFKILELLLSFKPDVNRYGFQNSPLHIALSHGHTHCASLLIQHGAVIDFYQALDFAADQQEPAYVRFLINNYYMFSSYCDFKSDVVKSSLLKSVRNGNLEITGLIFDFEPQVGGYPWKGTCPLAESRNGEIAKFLIDRGADVNHVIDNFPPFIMKGFTPLMIVLKNRDTSDNSVREIVQVLLENGASVNDTSKHGETPLMFAAKKENNMSVLQLLLDHGAELGGKDKKGNTALIHAIRAGCFENVSFLLKVVRNCYRSLNEENEDGITALMFAVEASSPAIVKELIEQGADVNIEDSNGNNALLHLLRSITGYTPVNSVLTKRDTSDNSVREIVQVLLENGASVNDTNERGETPLMWAAVKEENTSVLQLLLNHGAELGKVDEDGNTVLIYALGSGSSENVSFLHQVIRDRFLNVQNDDVITALMLAVEARSPTIIRELIDQGADVNVKDRNGNNALLHLLRSITGYTPLMRVLTKRDKRDNSVREIVQILLENGTSVNDTNEYGETPLMLAAKKEESMSVLQLLLDHGAKLGDMDKEGNTALIHAVRAGCSKNLTFLFRVIRDRKEFLNVQNDDSFTALMFAVTAKKPTIIKELIDHGADVNIKDRNGNHALLNLLRTSRKHNNKIIRLLVQAGCDVNWQNNNGLSPLMLAAHGHLKRTMRVLLDSGAEINAVSKTNSTETALSHLQYGGQKYFSCLEYLLDRGACLSYLAAKLLHKLISYNEIDIVLKLMRCGLRPVDVLGDNISDHVANGERLFSPLCTALCIGNSSLANFFVNTLFLTQSDISSLGHDRLLRQYLERRDYQKCLDVLDAIPTQPMSLENLSLMAVSTAVGSAPGREIRINELELPDFLKDKLLYKSQNTLLHPFGYIPDRILFLDDFDNSK